MDNQRLDETTPRALCSDGTGCPDVLRTSALERDILRVLGTLQRSREQDITGAMLFNTLEERGYANLSRGRFYPNLDQLVDKGHVNKQSGPDGRSNAYVLDESGVSLLLEYRARVLNDTSVLDEMSTDRDRDRDRDMDCGPDGGDA